MAGFDREINRNGDTLADLVVEHLASITIELKFLNRNIRELISLLKTEEVRLNGVRRENEGQGLVR